MWRGALDSAELSKIREQLDWLKTNYGSEGASALGATFEDINQRFTPKEIDSFADQISHNMNVAIHLIEESEQKRFK